MRIDFNKPYDKYADVLPFVTEDGKKALLERADGLLPVYEMTLAQFFACCGGDFSCVVKDKDHLTTGEAMWCERFADFVREFSDIVKRLSIPQTPEQKQASAGCLPVEWQEGILVFVRRYFGLRSFAEAEDVKIADFLLAKKDEYNSVTFERAIHNIQQQKIRRK